MPAAQPGALTADAVADAVYRAVRRCATHLRPDVLAAMQAAREDETQPRAQSVLDCLLENARIGQEDGVPICQDTGTCWVRLEVGEELLIPGNILSGVNDAVARAYTDGRLRMSVVADALLDRTNTGDNTPAFAEIALRPGRGATLHVLLKGGGSDNASRVVMLAPGAGRAGVVAGVVGVAAGVGFGGRFAIFRLEQGPTLLFDAVCVVVQGLRPLPERPVCNLLGADDATQGIVFVPVALLPVACAKCYSYSSCLIH